MAKPARSLRGDLVDAVVLEVYGLTRDQGWLADRALEKVLRRERRLYAGERRAASEALYGLVRWQGQIEWLLAPGSRPGEVPRRRPDPALAYAAFLVRKAGVAPEAAALRLGVAAPALAPLAEAGARLARLEDPAERLAAEESLPRWIAALLIAELGEKEAAALARAFNERAPLTVRVNLLRTTREELRERLAREGVGATPTRLSPWGLVLDGRVNAFGLAAFQDGLFEIQDEGSQLVALACGARPGQKVVDACAGAGGKALALAMEMRNKGSLHALDVDPDRLEEARRRARRAGVHNLRVRAIPEGEAAGPLLDDLAGAADRVLVDAPCSGLGALRRRPDARWRLSPGDPQRFAATQRELAVRFARLVKPGGRLVYATCAVGRAENEEVAESIAAEVGDLAPLPLREALGEELARAVGAAGHLATLLPHRHGTDGFFIAAFSRRG
jgi:16S rRNA (cytosine967-C5)-methyltransferase